MRFAAPLLPLVVALVLPAVAMGALSVEQAPTERPSVEMSDFKDGETARNYERLRQLRLEEQKRAAARSQAITIAKFVVPVILLVGIGIIVVKVRSIRSGHATYKKLKQLEARRRAGGPEQVLDPREW